MLVQDTLTGYLHEVPDSQVYGAYLGELPESMGENQVLFDGFGNPVGLPFLAPIASALAPIAAKALPTIASRIIPAATRALPGLVRSVTGAVQRIVPTAAQAITGAAQSMAPAIAAGAMQAGLAPAGFPTVSPMPFRPPLPPGWIRPPVPYTGAAPRRAYLRCSVWPGPQGLVPSQAAAMPGALLPGAPMPGVPLRRRRPIRRRR
jgi:hypothetical protein